MSRTIKPNQLESAQEYDVWRSEHERTAPIHICGYCLENEVEEAGMTCEYCEELLKEL